MRGRPQMLRFINLFRSSHSVKVKACQDSSTIIGMSLSSLSVRRQILTDGDFLDRPTFQGPCSVVEISRRPSSGGTGKPGRYGKRAHGFTTRTPTPTPHPVTPKPPSHTPTPTHRHQARLPMPMLRLFPRLA